ncbi:hypothetical protein M1N66_03705 [Thermodesulfovibrionales bacterium]|nr:hypothetical protein [Thermodesulfovibrionales bacterium]MCL0096694.1 hypothetical protein [Thermodesulfovibrionales bacterium]
MRDAGVGLTYAPQDPKALAGGGARSLCDAGSRTGGHGKGWSRGVSEPLHAACVDGSL